MSKQSNTELPFHSSHADIVSASSDSSELQAQSRNRILTTDLDNCGFAKFVEQHKKAFQDIIFKLRERTGGEHIVLSGEICGKGVQKGVGISQQTEKFLVILQVKVDGVWQKVTIWEDLSDETHRIYNIRKFPRYHVVIDMSDTMATFDEIDKMTKEVGKSCPVAAALGTPGTGEGIVWTPCAFPEHSRLWFKSKTDEHCVTPARNKESRPVSDATLAAMDLVNDNLTEARLDQGMDYLREFNMEPDMKHLGHFIKWLVEDILKESGTDLNADVVKASKKIIADRAKDWYIRKPDLVLL